ncbi:MAG TPA: ABC transporter transmembrane domain-containing protein, partial [Verrucomicrobiota bacterium]|nr:ABC transporter transmembrane domain-containing protein [Verrucomicrobiota bacterium]
MAAVVLTALLAAGLEMLTMALLAPLVGFLLARDGLPDGRLISLLMEALPGRSRAQYLVLISIAVIGATAAKNAVLYANSVLGARLRTRITVNLRHAMFRRLLAAPLTVFEQRPAGETASVFMTDTVRVMWMTDHIILMVQRSALLLAYVLTLFVISWPLTLWTMVLAGLLGVVVAGILRRARQVGAAVAEANRRLGAALVECFSGIRVLRTAHAERRSEEQFLGLCRQTGQHELTYMKSQAALVPAAETIGVGGALALLAGASLWMVRPGGLTPESLAVFAFAL